VPGRMKRGKTIKRRRVADQVKLLWLLPFRPDVDIELCRACPLVWTHPVGDVLG
jgi:hypothetical protein